MATCAVCGAELPEGARFCPNCGSAVTVQVETAERKLVTVVFADLVDSTGLAQRLDPERAREVISAYYAVASQELASLRGRAEKFIGDAVMAVFGLPGVHEDDAVRAVRAALAIRERTRRLGDELGLGVDLDVHVGVASGHVAVGESPAGQLLATGPAVNLAARLQDEAEPGEVLVSDVTRDLTRDSVEFGEPRLVDAAGFDEPIVAHPVIRLAARRSRRTIPLVGRRSELNLLEETYRRAMHAKRAHLVTLLGEPGIGKSRLVQEFVAGLGEEVTVLTGRAVVWGGEVTFWPLVEMLRAEAGIHEDDTPEQIRERLGELAAGCCTRDEADQVAAQLALALGVGEEGTERQFLQQEVQAGFRNLLLGLGARGPLVLVFEDLHAAQPAFLDLIEQAVLRVKGVPLFALCVAREELLEDRPGWGGGRSDSVTLHLDPLDPGDSAELVRQSAGEEIDDETVRQVAERAGGNPFFIVETTGMLLHEVHEGGARTTRLPVTVHAVVASRLDHLSEPARDLARKMSVFRPPVDTSELALVTEVSEAALAELEQEEVLVRDDEDRSQYRFRHQVLRDVAYDSLPKRERRRLHQAVADELIARGLASRYPQAIAYHLEHAARAALDLDPEETELRERAVEALGDAGDRLRRRMELRTAIDLYQRGLSLAGPREAWTDREAGMLAGIGEAEYWLAEYDAARTNLSRALEIGAESARVKAHASRFLADIVLNVDGDLDAAERLFADALEAAERLDDPYVVARVRLMAAWVHSWRGDPASAEKEWREVVEFARAHEDRWAEARALANLCSANSAAGDEREAMELATEALRLGEEMGDRFTVAVSRQFLGNSFRRMGRYGEAIEMFSAAIKTFEDLGARWELGAALSDRGEVRRLSGDLRGAERDYREALSIMAALDERSYVGFIHEELAVLAALEGRHSDAEEHLEKAERLVTLNDMVGRAGPLETRAEISLPRKDREAALAATLEALEILRGSAYRNRYALALVQAANRFGAGTVGGDAAVRDAQERLDRVGWAVPPDPPGEALPASD
jgi:class 3 adenylate cyclase/tetratricopeptide (TPR) repeat protein